VAGKERCTEARIVAAVPARGDPRVGLRRDPVWAAVKEVAGGGPTASISGEAGAGREGSAGEGRVSVSPREDGVAGAGSKGRLELRETDGLLAGDWLARTEVLSILKAEAGMADGREVCWEEQEEQEEDEDGQGRRGTTTPAPAAPVGISSSGSSDGVSVNRQSGESGVNTGGRWREYKTLRSGVSYWYTPTSFVTSRCP